MAAFSQFENWLDGSGAPSVISAIMGAGKSLVIAEAAFYARARGGTVVVSTSSQRLVRSLTETIRMRCRGAFNVGSYYQHEKRLDQIIVTCMPSMRNLARQLRQHGRQVSLWIADECHKSQAGTVIEAQEAMAPRWSLGFTATPYRSDRHETLQLFRGCLYRYGVAEAMRDGVIVPWRVVPYTGGLKEGGSKQTIDPLDRACLELISQGEGPGLVNATDIEDAESFCRLLVSRGYKSAPLHSLVPSPEQDRRLELLRSGELDTIVYVNMLSEGVDFPWLRWMCLRREVGARVRFMQEVGRLLRAHPGKSHAVFFDPHDLFGSFKLSYQEALGEPPERPPRVVDPKRASEIIESEKDPAVVLAWIESVVRTLTIACDVQGWIPDRRTIRKTDRLKPATPSQVAVISTLWLAARSHAPDNWAACLGLVSTSGDLRFGFAADLVSVFSAVVDQGSWPRVDEDGRIGSER